ncbi:MAG: glutathione S-transferase family protein [Myxococcota bacterium]
MAKTDSPYIFHGADVSYFSGKVRPAFPHKGLWFREIMPDILEIKRRTGLNYFPAVETPDGEFWQDTSDILDQLEAAHPSPPLFPTSPVQRVVAYLIELYGDEIGILPAMHYRWSFEESVNKVSVDFSTPTRNQAGGRKFAGKMAGALPFLGVHPETIPAIEAHTRELLDRLCTHFAEHRYLLGDALSLADCGLMGPFYGHLYRDAVPERLLYETAFHVCAWIERVNRPSRDQTGWFADDTLAETLLPVLQTMADGVPMLLASARATEARVEAQAETANENENRGGLGVEGGVEMVESNYRDITLSSGARPYTYWMMQRALDAYAELDTASRERVDSALAGTGWEELLAFQPRHRLAKQNYQLVWDSVAPREETS